MWAKIIHNGHWDDYEKPHPVPLINGTPKQTRFTDALTGVANAVVTALKQQNCNTPTRSMLMNQYKYLTESTRKTKNLGYSTIIEVP